MSWDEAFDLSAQAQVNIAETYSGEEGQRKLLAQGYDPVMVEATRRRRHPGHEVSRWHAAAGHDPRLRAVPDGQRHGPARRQSAWRRVRSEAVGARGWDNYSWHTDLPPGHPMVTGQQTVDFDLCNVEHGNLVLVWGMNWICTKMPDAHWMTEARMKGTKIVVIAAEYCATTCKADEAIVVRPGTTPALALGLAQVLIAEELFDADYVKANTDLPLLIRRTPAKCCAPAKSFPPINSPR